MPSVVLAITPRTDAEWPADHPSRAHCVVLTDAELARVQYLVCSRADDERLPPPAGDHDIPGRCHHCGCGIVYRASAPRFPTRVCVPCWLLHAEARSIVETVKRALQEDHAHG